MYNNKNVYKVCTRKGKYMEISKFNELQVSEEIKRAIEDLGYEEPSPIQAQAIPCMIEGHDVIGQAQTGTGKTASFSIPILENIDRDNRKLQAIVLCPTRELAIQVSEEVRKLAKYMQGITYPTNIWWTAYRQANKGPEGWCTGRNRYTWTCNRPYK